MPSLDEQIAALEWVIAVVAPTWVHQQRVAALKAALITLKRIRREVLG